MKLIKLFIILSIVGCQSKGEKLSQDEIAKIKNDIITRSEKHASDLENMDYNAVMTFYENSDSTVIFGDGYYWGDYKTIDGIWGDIVGKNGWKKILYWNLKNHKVHVFSKEAASYLVEFDHMHITPEGDTAGSSGCFTYGMQKIEGNWKAVTVHVSHIPVRDTIEKWWYIYSPERRKGLIKRLE
ncbi:MAG: hypothetical protein ABI675_17880 [Chitinophagaceae bacterium]